MLIREQIIFLLWLEQRNQVLKLKLFAVQEGSSMMSVNCERELNPQSELLDLCRVS